MAAGDPKMVIIVGAASATLATAVSNYNTAVQTLLTNQNAAIWLPTAQGGNVPICLNSGMQVLSDAAVGNNQSYGWGQFQYLSAS